MHNQQHEISIKMKKIICISLILCFISTVCSAQINEMKFVGVPMNQHYTSFIEQLKEKGFSYSPQQTKWDFKGYDCITLKGNFWQFKDCEIRVKYSIIKGTVASVAVRKENFSVWKNKVYELMNNLDIKYGNRIEVENSDYTSQYRWLSTDPAGMVNVSWTMIYSIDLFMIEYFTTEETTKILNKEIEDKKKELEGL